MIRNIQFAFYGMLLMFVFYSCTSAPSTLPTKLDLTEERQLVEDMKNLAPEQRTVILQAFDKADSYSDAIRIYARELEEQIAKLKSELVSEKEDAAAYRKWRNWLIGISFLAISIVILFIAWRTSSFWLPIARKLIGIPI